MATTAVSAALKFLKGLYGGEILKVTPFHDDRQLQKFVKGMIGTGLEAFFETGTFRGDTLGWVAKEFPNLPCLSCESSRVFYAWARARIRAGNVHIYLEDSTEFLAEHIGSYRSALFWLDAHWGENWPILEEIRIILNSGIRGVALVDDFDIGRDGFGFDSFHGQPMNLEYLSPLIRKIHVPNYRPGVGYRGYAIIPIGIEVPVSLLSSYEPRYVSSVPRQVS